jgi:hypothetical protein
MSQTRRLAADVAGYSRLMEADEEGTLPGSALGNVTSAAPPSTMNEWLIWADERTRSRGRRHDRRNFDEVMRGSA